MKEGQNHVGLEAKMAGQWRALWDADSGSGMPIPYFRFSANPGPRGRDARCILRLESLIVETVIYKNLIYFCKPAHAFTSHACQAGAMSLEQAWQDPRATSQAS